MNRSVDMNRRVHPVDLQRFFRIALSHSGVHMRLATAPTESVDTVPL